MYKLEDLYGRRIYSKKSSFVGVAKDVLIDTSEGKIKFLLKDQASSILGRERADAKNFIKENFIPFEKVQAIRDIIIIE
ncbi:MAG: PRC-barrel domain-containing protein [Candidatus Micrarchaeota archaeon]